MVSGECVNFIFSWRSPVIILSCAAHDFRNKANNIMAGLLLGLCMVMACWDSASKDWCSGVTAGLLFVLAQNQKGKQKVRIAGIGMIVHGKCFGLAKITGAIEIQHLSFLWRANACIRVEWRVCVGWSFVAHSPMGGKQPVPTQMQNDFWVGVVS